jgi:N-acetylmuramoyl-L-alanine amidase
MSEIKIDNYEGKYNITRLAKRDIKYIVIHYTAGTSSAKGKALSTAKYFNKTETKASADFIVDDETIVQYNQDLINQYTWHCGGSKYKTKGGSFYKKCTNANSIGIELCSTNKKKKVEDANSESWYFTMGVFNNAVLLVCKLIEDLKVQGIEIPLENVIRHYEVNGKLCPGIIGWNADSGNENEWISFKKELNNLINNNHSDSKDLKDEVEKCKKEIEKWKKMYEEKEEENKQLKSDISKLTDKLLKISEIAKS